MESSRTFIYKAERITLNTQQVIMLQSSSVSHPSLERVVDKLPFKAGLVDIGPQVELKYSTRQLAEQTRGRGDNQEIGNQPIRFLFPHCFLSSRFSC